MKRERVTGRLLHDLGGFWAGYRQLHERQQLRARPWLEDVLHFDPDGRLHGHLAPPDGGRSVTSDGWCPGQARIGGAARDG